MAPHSSTPAWKIPWAVEPGRLQSMGSLRVRHVWAASLSRVGKAGAPWCSINTYWRTPLLKTKIDLNLSSGTSLMVQWLAISLPMQGTRDWSPVGERRCHVPKPACRNYGEACVQQRGAHVLQLRPDTAKNKHFAPQNMTKFYMKQLSMPTVMSPSL